MRRIKTFLSVGVVTVALLSMNAGSAMAGEIEEFEIDGNEVEIELVGGGNLEYEHLDGDVFGFDVFGFDVFKIEDNDFSINDDDEREVTSILDIG